MLIARQMGVCYLLYTESPLNASMLTIRKERKE